MSDKDKKDPPNRESRPSQRSFTTSDEGDTTPIPPPAPEEMTPDPRFSPPPIRPSGFDLRTSEPNMQRAIEAQRKRPPTAKHDVATVEQPATSAEQASDKPTRSERQSHDRERARALFHQLADLPDDDPTRSRVRDELGEMHLPLGEGLAGRFRSRGGALHRRSLSEVQEM